jgi:hypothetical protein
LFHCPSATETRCSLRQHRARTPPSPSRIVPASGDRDIRLYLDNEAHVAEESRELAGEIRGLPEADPIADCDRRVKVWRSQCPDHEMDHFNGYVFALELLLSFKGVILADPR